jgi:hypothetical protein
MLKLPMSTENFATSLFLPHYKTPKYKPFCSDVLTALRKSRTGTESAELSKDLNDVQARRKLAALTRREISFI